MSRERVEALLVEDSPADSRLIAELVREITTPKIVLRAASSLAEALERVRDPALDVVLLDLSLADSCGIETFERIHAARPELATIILTGLSDDQFALRTLQCGAQDYLVKGEFDANLLKRCLEYAIERKHAEEQIRTLNAELEQRVIERTRELQAANRELEAFGYTVAHDLRRPLRAIDGFSAVCVESLGGRLEPRERQYFDRIRRACEQMDALINALLKLSRISLQKLRAERVDLNAVAHDVAAELMRSDPCRGVDFVIADNLEFTGDPSLLRLLVENLLSNAWKFTRRQPHPRIELGTLFDADSTPLGQRACFVSDNGVGFDMEFADKLFAPFERLHGDTEFEGIGVGLATVQRIVQRHGGRIWANGDQERGATFYFTLPTKA